MFTINKIESDVKPKTFESLNNGVWYYNFNIELLEEKYRFCLVRINGTPTISKCYNAVLQDYINENGTSLLNSINTPVSNESDLLSEIYEMIEIDFGLKDRLSLLELEKRKILKEIDNYDKSIEVNSFFLNGLQVWLDKATRVGLMNSLNIEKISGKETSTLWFGNIKLEIDTNAAILMLSDLELYALECYNKTAEHKTNVQNLTSNVLDYDYTKDYPEKLSFNI